MYHYYKQFWIIKKICPATVIDYNDIFSYESDAINITTFEYGHSHTEKIFNEFILTNDHF